MTSHTLRVIDIVPGTSVDGPGLRTSIYFSGCHHRCEGCHNPQSWDMNAGKEMSVDEIMSVIDENGFNVTFSGGDPIYQSEALLPLAQAIRQRGYGIWCYTGFRYEELLEMPYASRLLPYIDVVVDSPFDLKLRDISLRFRGSSNQRLIDVRRSNAESKIILWGE